MFGWLRAKCPLDTWEKAWTETRMLWLANTLGIERLTRAEVILPTPQFFPDPYQPNAEGARRLLDRLCGYMGVTDRKIEMEVRDDAQMPGAAGHYDISADGMIRVARSQLANPMSLVATLAHELSHDILLRNKHLTTETTDHEWITDLLPVFLGVGIFAANATVWEKNERSGRSYRWSVGRQGYLPSRMFGYAMALFVFMREEEMPAWKSYLRPDASTALSQGLRFLRQTEDTVCHPRTIRAANDKPTVDGIVRKLQAESPSARLAALWETGDNNLDGPFVASAVTELLSDTDPHVVGAAALQVVRLREQISAERAVPNLVRALSYSIVPTQVAAAQAIGALRPNPATVLDELRIGLQCDEAEVVAACAEAIACLGPAAQVATADLFAALKKSVILDCDAKTSRKVARSLLTVIPHPRWNLRKYLQGCDQESRRQIFAELHESQDSTPEK
ncbi:MAG: hypothetical protein K8T25_21305 [Planctomycetia bacterium]|nr:hypothetical protein [Planctomycetia bacterium]